ncbi:MAG: hypothetical protein HXY50_10625 [Ignavibacteriaceae bacterium]|nr:hypothetical protein [Ignavibacteriaceae bacterium]
MKKYLYKILILVIILLAIIYLVRSELFRLFPSTDLVELSKRELRNTALQAIKEGDNPVSAVVLYNYTLVGRGHNTMISDTNAAGHAIINALNDVVKTMGWTKFNSLDKNSIIVMSTAEPCQFCKSFLLEYGIQKIEFMNKLPIDYWFTSYLDDFNYEVKKRQLEPSDLQDSLIQLKTSRQINFQP